MEAPKPRRLDAFDFSDIDFVETARGSRYQYLDDGTTQRFKAVEGRTYEPQSALVYVPDYAWIKAHAPREILERLGDNEATYHETLLEYIQNPRKDGRKAYIVDKKGKIIETNETIKNAEGPIYLNFLKDGKSDFTIPVTPRPTIGFMTFDTRRYRDEKTGESMRERHLGNAVTKIVRKQDR